MERSRFSPSGDLLAVSGSDGRLRIWETKDKTGALKQEFIPSAHLSATCTCVEWAPTLTSGGKGAGKKRKKSGFDGDLLALGTADGSLLFYGVAKSTLQAHTKPGHSGPVASLAWSPLSLFLYSCGEDGFIVEWDAENAVTNCRWKGGKGSLSSICIFKDLLLSSGRGITLWNLETKTSLMNFMGQPAMISQMEPIINTDYFVTMSLREMHLQIWSKSEQSAVATLTLPENARSFNVLSTSSGKVAVSVVTETGTLCTFQHKLNGPLRKPLAPSCVLSIQNSSDSSKVPVLTSILSNEDEDNSNVKLCYGSWLMLKFETMSLKNMQDKVTIKRDFGVKSKVGKKHGKDSQQMELEVTEVPKDAKHLQPGSELNLSTPLTEGKAKKRKKEERNKEDEGELLMEDRLSNLTIDKPSSTKLPDGNNLAHLLSQGLHSKDGKILHTVLSRWDHDVIDNTVRSIPVQMVVPLLQEIKKMMTNKPTMNHSVIRWLSSIFKIHSAFLMSCPSSEDLFGPLMSLLHASKTLLPQMCQLKGKLELIKGTIESKDHKAEIPNEALLVYHDESSDDGEDEDMIPSESEEFLGSDELIDDDEEEEEDSDDGNESDEGGSEEDSESEEEEKKVNGRVGESDEEMDED